MLNQEENPKMYHIQCRKGDVGEYVFLPGDPFRTDKIASFLDDPKLIAHNREHKTWTGYLNGVKVSVTSTGMGCASTAIAVEELIKCGAKTFIRIGTAGPVKDPDDDKKYDCVVVTGAVRDDGTSREYVPIQFPAIADRHVVDALSRAATDMGLKVLEGITQSKDSFYGEVEPDTSPVGERLKRNWYAYQKAGVCCSEMECSAIFCVCACRGTRGSAIMNWGDMDKTIQAACNAVKLLIEEEKK